MQLVDPEMTPLKVASVADLTDSELVAIEINCSLAPVSDLQSVSELPTMYK